MNSAFQPCTLQPAEVRQVAELVQELLALRDRTMAPDTESAELLKILKRLPQIPSDIVMLGTQASQEQIGAADFVTVQEAMVGVLQHNAPALRALAGWAPEGGNA